MEKNTEDLPCCDFCGTTDRDVSTLLDENPPKMICDKCSASAVDPNKIDEILAGKKAEYPWERMVFAFDIQGQSHLLYAKGPGIEGDIDAVGLSPEDLGLDGFPQPKEGEGETIIVAELPPDRGIWIYDCLPVAQYSGGTPDSPTEFDGMDYHGLHRWRRPAPHEINLILTGNWDGLSALWKDVPSLEEWTDKNKTSP